MDAYALYTALSVIHVGAVAPDSIYLCHYADGTAPIWRLIARVDLGDRGLQLTFEDDHNRTMFTAVRLIVLAFPGRVLRTPPQPHGDFETAILGGRLCDLTQQGRYAQKHHRTRRVSHDNARA